ncbi:F0F1 ATP synthase subunit alpha [Pseudomonadota bacterium]
MSKLVKKIEDIIDEVATTVSFDPQASAREKEAKNQSSVTFPKILDFAFPDGVSSSFIAQVGEVTYVGDGVVHATGLDRAKIDEIVEIRTAEGAEKALILGIREDRVEAVVLGDYSNIKRAQEVKSTGSKLRIPSGSDLLGRVISPLGLPIDGKGPTHSSSHRDVEFPAPGVLDRSPIKEPLETGVMVLDSTIPVGKGQRELVIGDRKTGKSRTMLDIISNQKGRNVYCIYVGVGMQAAKAKATYELLEKRGALKHTTLVISLADDPPSLQYIAPYTGAALGEHFMYEGKHALVVYDDLSKQAKAYRQVSLLLKRSPGRDAYPGDIFFLHSRLLERASKLSLKKKGGSLTALPVAETQGGDVSDYIITNLMSITDGHIYLDANMMHEGILPAVNSGTSVSRIGGKVQSKLLQKVGELTGRTLARYNEVKSFETINTEVAEDTIRDINRGKRIREILSQDSDLNLTFDEQIVMLGISTSSRMDHLELQNSITFKENIIPFYRKEFQNDVKSKIESSKELKEIDTDLDRIFFQFSKKYKLPLANK